MKYLFITFVLFVSLFATNEKVSLQLQWKHQFQFAGFYVAKEKGFYDEAGLDVEIREFRSDADIVKDVLSKKANFGIGKSSLLISKCQKKPIALLGAIFQSSPSVLVTSNPKIKSLSDLKNKRVMITPDSVSSASILAMLKSNGVDVKDLKIQKHSFDIKDLVEGKTDAVSVYVSNEPYSLHQNNISFKLFDPKKYGYDFYGDLLYTSSYEIENHPKRVEAFYKASLKGWKWAFQNIDETIEIIQKKYNTQNRSKEALKYEAQKLKKLAFKKGVPLGYMSKNKFADILKNYKLSGFISECKLDGFVDPLHLNKQHIKIGVLAKRGDQSTYKRWSNLAEYLNETLEEYSFEIVPLGFRDLEDAIKNKEVEFLITNPGYYVYLEDRYKILRIATLVNNDFFHNYNLKQYGGVIITQKNNTHINKLKDLTSKSFAAVDKNSFGGWIVANDLFVDTGIDINDINVKFFDTHDNVVKEVLSSKVDAGIVRTDTLENMEREGLININEIKVIHPQEYDNFPFLISTKLYPEWPFSKLQHTSDELSLKVLSRLVRFDEDDAQISKNDRWSIPADYTLIHETLKKLNLAPYDSTDIDLKDIYREYEFYIYLFSIFLIAVAARSIYLKYLNRHLVDYNKRLNSAVHERTKELQIANEQLKVLAQTDFLTGVANRRSFMKLANKYFDIAKRNDTPLQMCSMDLDLFKHVNDTYGHQAGDIVLVEFTNIVSSILRKSDIFGRVGGEEFCLLMQNTSRDGALQLAQRICKSVESRQIKYLDTTIQVTVSIGIVSLQTEKSIEELLKKSDDALYQAKQSGRNRVVMV